MIWICLLLLMAASAAATWAVLERVARIKAAKDHKATTDYNARISFDLSELLAKTLNYAPKPDEPLLDAVVSQVKVKVVELGQSIDEYKHLKDLHDKVAKELSSCMESKRKLRANHDKQLAAKDSEIKLAMGAKNDVLGANKDLIKRCNELEKKVDKLAGEAADLTAGPNRYGVVQKTASRQWRAKIYGYNHEQTMVGEELKNKVDAVAELKELRITDIKFKTIPESD